MSEQEVEKPVLYTEDIASFLDLKTEFIRRKEAALASKKQQQEPESAAVHINKTKNNILAVTKEEKKNKQEVTAQRVQRIRQNEEELKKDEEQRQRQRQILEQKAKIYERMAKGERLIYEDGKEAEFLVDFHIKKKELEESREKREKAVAGGVHRQQHDDNDETDEELRRSDDERERRAWEEPSPLVVHYDPSEEKGRVFGPSHVPLPVLDEDARERRIAELKAMSEETKKERVKRKKERNAKKAEERRRLNRLRQRRTLREKLQKLQRPTKRTRWEILYSDESSLVDQQQQSQVEMEQDAVVVESSVDDENEAPDVEFQKGMTQKGGVCIWHGGYRYVRKCANRFRCSNKDCKCTATILVEENSAIRGKLGGPAEHNHAAEPQRREAESGRERLKEKARGKNGSRLKPSKALTEVCSQVNDEVFARMGEEEALCKMMRREKNKLFGKVNIKNLLELELPDLLIKKGDESILLYDIREVRRNERDVVLSCYVAYIANCKLIDEETLPFIEFMQRSFVELTFLHPGMAYQYAFVYIRQFSIHLRNAMIAKRKDLIQTVHNW